MSKFLFILLFTFNLSSAADIPSINVIRSLHQKAAREEKYCKELIDLLEQYNDGNQPLLLGYKGSATMMKAKYARDPFSKLSYFGKGKNMLEKAITADENNTELRFLRLAAQANAPSFLGYDDKINSDKSFLLNSVAKLTDSVLKKTVVLYLKSSGLLTNDQKSKLQ